MFPIASSSSSTAGMEGRARAAGRMLFCLALALSLLLGASQASAHGRGSDHDHEPTMNHHVVDDGLITGGHFIEGGLEKLAAEGVTVVIDLRDDPPANQQEKLAAEGVTWVNIPVAWDDPKPEDYTAFAEAMQAHAGEKVLVQCQANYRASAMTYLYRVKEEGVSERKAAGDLEAVWQPAGTWGRYIEAVLEN